VFSYCMWFEIGIYSLESGWYILAATIASAIPVCQSYFCLMSSFIFSCACSFGPRIYWNFTVPCGVKWCNFDPNIYNLICIPMQMCILIFIGNNGETYINTAALVSCVQNFPKSRGPVVGILKCVAGLSGAILT